MTNDDFPMTQDDIERFFRQTEGSAAPAALRGKNGRNAGQVSNLPPVRVASAPAADAAPTVPVAEAPPAKAAAAPQPEADVAAQDAECLLAEAEKALQTVNPGRGDETPAGLSAYQFSEFSPAAPATETATLDLVRDVELDLKIELGRTHMYLEDVLKLRKGAVVPLDKLAGDPVDIYVNGRLIARGEVLVLNDNFCVRVTELIAGANVFA